MILTIISHVLYFLNGTETQALRLWHIIPNFGASLRILFLDLGDWSELGLLK